MFRTIRTSLKAQVAVLILGGTALSVAFVAAALLWMFERSLDSQLDNHLSAYADILAAAVHVENGELAVDGNSELLTSIPRHWQITLPDGRTITSPLLNAPLQLPPDTEPGRFNARSGADDLIVYQRSLTFPGNQRLRFAFGLEAGIADHYKATLRSALTDGLINTLLAVALFLSAIGGLVLIVVTWPLNRASRALSRVERGQDSRITGTFPTEIAALTDQVNALLDYSDTVMERHRTFSSNVSHALKTSLTVIRNETDSALIQSRVDAAMKVIDRNLARAQSAGGRTMLAPSSQARPIADRLVAGFRRVYDTAIHVTCEDSLTLRIDEADLYEMLGNLVENGCKFSRAHVWVRIEADRIIVEDDGPGLPEEDYDQVLARGVRLDQTKPGSGIGLAITRDIAELNGGHIALGRSAKGGLQVTLTF